MRVLITGAAGQDGTLLSQLVVQKGHRVLGLVKPGVPDGAPAVPEVVHEPCDLGDADSLRRVVEGFRPDLVFNLGGITSVAEAEEDEDLTRRVVVDAVEVLLQASQRTGARLVQAGSALIFEGCSTSPQTEDTEPAPMGAYARGKADAMELVATARDRGQFAVTAILYNHESPLRDLRFVTRKITHTVARIANGLADELVLGSLDARRDWGWAPDYVAGMWLMAQAQRPHDYILATGVQHSVLDFAKCAFESAGVDDWERHIRVSDQWGRVSDPNLLQGDSTRAYTALGWRHTLTFPQIAAQMVQHDLNLLRDEFASWPSAAGGAGVRTE